MTEAATQERSRKQIRLNGQRPIALAVWNWPGNTAMSLGLLLADRQGVREMLSSTQNLCASRPEAAS